MKRIEIIANEIAFSNLATFETIEELNETVRTYKRQLALGKTELAVLDILHRYSAKYKGVSFLCKNKIGELIGKSRRTIIRVCQRLESLGVIRQLPMKRASDMQQTSNAIVIQPVVNTSQDANVTQEPAENVTPVRQLPSKTNTVINNTYPDGLVPATPYAKFKQFVNNFVSDSKLTSRLYGIYLAQTHYLHMSEQYDADDLFNNGLQALKITFQTTKRKRLRNIAGYYNGVLNGIFNRLLAEVMEGPTD
jgi:hypothetical protein